MTNTLPKINYTVSGKYWHDMPEEIKSHTNLVCYHTIADEQYIESASNSMSNLEQFWFDDLARILVYYPNDIQDSGWKHNPIKTTWYFEKSKSSIAVMTRPKYAGIVVVHPAFIARHLKEFK